MKQNSKKYDNQYFMQLYNTCIKQDLNKPTEHDFKDFRNKQYNKPCMKFH